MFARLVQPAATMVLARLLLPSDYGVVAAALAVTTAIDLVRDMGMGSALVQRREWDDDVAATAFWVSFGFGALAWFVLALLAGWIAATFDEPRVAPVLVVLGGVSLASSLGMVPQVLLTRRLDFRRLFLCSFAATLANPVVAIPLAYGGAEEWALVAGMVAAQLSSLATLLWLVRWWPRRVWNGAAARAMLPFGSKVCAESLMGWGVGAADVLLMARFLPLDLVGGYRMAQFIALWPSNNLTQPVSRVVFSAASRLQDDVERIGMGFRKAIRCGAIGVLPVGALISVSAPEFVPAFLGPRWADAVPMVRILAVAGMFFSLVGLVPPVYRGLGRVGIMPRFMAVRLLVSVPALYVASTHGALPVCWTVLGLVALFAPINLFICSRVLSLPYRAIVADMRAGLLGAVVAGLAYGLFQHYVGGVVSRPAPRFLGGALVACGACLLFLKVAYPEGLREAVALLRA